MKNFQGKVAFVTGGASGIGKGMVKSFLAEGMKVVIADYNQALLSEARAEFAASDVHCIAVDVADRVLVKAAAEEAVQVFGKIHVLCNNAGADGGSSADDPEFDSWDRSLSINLGGVVNGCKTIIPIIKAQGEGGHVVNTASMAGVVPVPMPQLGTYMTAKFAVRGLSESLRLSLAPEGIGVSCLFPGATSTGLVPVPEDYSGAPEGEAGELLRALWDSMKVAMTPEQMGAEVVKAIKENRLHILTHDEFLDEFKQRNRDMESAFADMGEIPAARIRFENMRRQMVDDLQNLSVKD